MIITLLLIVAFGMNDSKQKTIDVNVDETFTIFEEVEESGVEVPI